MRRHSFNIARQGYLSLLSGPAPTSGDNPDMVVARDRFLSSGAYAPLKDAIAEVVAEYVGLLPHPRILDVGCGTGYYLGGILTALEDRGEHATDAVGIGFDTATRAVRLAARAHPRIMAFTWDVFRDFPLVDSSVDCVLDIFSPRNGSEFHRVVAPGGHAVVVTPEPEHLQELRSATDMVGIDPDKEQRLHRTMRAFEHVGTKQVRFSAPLTPESARDLIFMTPSARHLDSETITDSQLPTSATVAVHISVWRK